MTLLGEPFEKQPLTGNVPNLSVKRSSLKNGGDPRRGSVTFATALRHDEDNTRPLVLNRLDETEETYESDRTPIVKNTRKPMARIPTEAKLRTITHKVKRPAVDIEFHDLVYTAKTATGEYPFVVEYIITNWGERRYRVRRGSTLVKSRGVYRV